MVNESIVPMEEDAEPYPEGREDAFEHVPDSISGSETGIYRNHNTDGPDMVSAEVLEIKQNNNAPTRKLGFGLVGPGKRTTVPSVFHEEGDEGVDDKKMSPLVPIDYSTEELQVIQPSASVPSSNLVAAAEFAKHISGVSAKEISVRLKGEKVGDVITYQIIESVTRLRIIAVPVVNSRRGCMTGKGNEPIDLGQITKSFWMRNS